MSQRRASCRHLALALAVLGMALPGCGSRRQSSSNVHHRPGNVREVTAGPARPQPPAVAVSTTKPFEEGLASYYGGGDGYHGKRTANGEVFDQNAMTAAHKTLPFNTMVKVVRKDTGANVTVRVNDRGPFKKGRVIDVSYAAAKQLKMVTSGVVPVRLYVVKVGPGGGQR
jgi:rare lipoprotein A